MEELIKGINDTGREINNEVLEEIVSADKKGRYSFSSDKTKIRANQGHSIKVDVELKEIDPPEILYHGTATRFLDSIMKTGLTGQKRLYVHLSKDEETAITVGKRHGKPVVLKVESTSMSRDGYQFYQSENGVYLTKEVPVKYLN